MEVSGGGDGNGAGDDDDDESSISECSFDGDDDMEMEMWAPIVRTKTYCPGKDAHPKVTSKQHQKSDAGSSKTAYQNNFINYHESFITPVSILLIIREDE